MEGIWVDSGGKACCLLDEMWDVGEKSRRASSIWALAKG